MLAERTTPPADGEGAPQGGGATGDSKAPQGSTNLSPNEPPTPRGAAADDENLTLNGITFSKVQKRDRWIAYDATEEEIGAVYKLPGESRWHVRVSAEKEPPAITFTSSVAARAFLLGYYHNSASV